MGGFFGMDIGLAKESLKKENVFGISPFIETKEIVDPMKKSVATPLSEYLKSQIGKGLPAYGGELTTPLDKNTENRFTEFLSMNPSDFFKKNVADPTFADWSKNALPAIEEGWAGSLRGSGRFRGVEDSATDLSKQLATVGGTLVPQIYGQQITTGITYKAMKDQENLTKYNAWMQTLPGANPAISQALNFLNDQTSSGTTTLSALNPGQEGWFKDFVKGLMGGVGGMAGGMSTAQVKHDIKPVENSLDKVLKLQGVLFKWNGTDEDGGGVIAEEVEKVMPEATYNVCGVKHIRPLVIMAHLIEAIKEVHNAKCS
jgi:hypothetical protein